MLGTVLSFPPFNGATNNLAQQGLIFQKVYSNVDVLDPRVFQKV